MIGEFVPIVARGQLPTTGGSAFLPPSDSDENGTSSAWNRKRPPVIYSPVAD
jgi:hypothetical protein